MNEENTHTIEGDAIKILKIDKPRAFNMYYFVEKKKGLASSLDDKIKKEFPNKKCYVLAEDCNKKLKDLAKFLRQRKEEIIKY